MTTRQPRRGGETPRRAGGTADGSAAGPTGSVGRTGRWVFLHATQPAPPPALYRRARPATVPKNTQGGLLTPLSACGVPEKAAEEVRQGRRPHGTGRRTGGRDRRRCVGHGAALAPTGPRRPGQPGQA